MRDPTHGRCPWDAPRRAHRLQTAQRMRTSTLFLLIALLPACVAPIQVQGGGRGQVLTLPAEGLGEGLAPLVAGTEEAEHELARLRSRESTAYAMLYAGLGMLVPCIALNAAAQQGTDVGELAYVGLPACAVSAVLDLVGVALAPSTEDWGEVLRLYNRAQPAQPWSAPALGVP
jgi:hypothetical protein